jgi:hypothetical protein
MRLMSNRTAIVSMTILGIHTVYVFAVASSILRVLALGEPGYHLWGLVIIPDLPVYILGILTMLFLEQQFGDDHFWAYTFLKWLFLVGGALQWCVITWLVSFIWNKFEHTKRTL